MNSLSDLYKKEGVVAAPSAPPLAATSVDAKAPPSTSAGTAAPILETPPGLPQEYIDVNLKNQPLPQNADMAAFEYEKEKPLNIRLIPAGESMCNATDIPY